MGGTTLKTTLSPPESKFFAQMGSAESHFTVPLTASQEVGEDGGGSMTLKTALSPPESKFSTQTDTAASHFTVTSTARSKVTRHAESVPQPQLLRKL